MSVKSLVSTAVDAPDKMPRPTNFWGHIMLIYPLGRENAANLERR